MNEFKMNTGLFQTVLPVGGEESCKFLKYTIFEISHIN
jgi:hypothetical protein